MKPKNRAALEEHILTVVEIAILALAVVAVLIQVLQ
jgi:hypothetical protein